MTHPTPATVAASALTTDKTHLPAASLSRVSPKTRARAADNGEAMKDGSFPIRDGADLKRAVNAFGRAKDKGAAKRHIIRRAKALDKIEVLPESWQALALKEFPGQRTEKPVEEDAFTQELMKAMTEPITASAPATSLLCSFSKAVAPTPDLLDDELLVKADRHNADAPNDRLVSVAKLKAVYRRGLSEYSVRPCVTPEQYAHARVNSFLRLLSTGAPDSASYTCDNDLLPRTHPAALTTAS